MQHDSTKPAGLASDALESAWRVVVEGAEQGAYAGAVALIARGGTVVLWRATGWAVLEPERIPMAADTIFDLASLTKVVATLPSILRLVQHGAISLDLPVGNVLPEFGTSGPKRAITIRRLLSHCGGLPAWLPLYLDHVGPEAYVAEIARTPLIARPGDRVVYSDLGFILLGEVIRRVSGVDVAEFAAREVFAPLGLRDTSFRPSLALRRRIAATERQNETEIEMCGDRAMGFAGWRKGVIWGEVHDQNAHYGLGGVSGHAGLFGTASDLFRYGQMWLQRGAWDGRQVIDEALVDESTRPMASGRGLGWVLSPPDGEAAPDHPGRGLSARAYGHTGFTGTSLWVDPERQMVIVLLTNRVHPTRRPEIAAIRPAFHAKVASAWWPDR